MRRGDIRTAVLAVLAEGPGHGYELMQRLEEKSEGAWRPSPGSIYPTLQLLEDEGLARATERDGKRVYEITDAGREEATRRIDEAGGAPWDDAGRGGPSGGFVRALKGINLAARQIMVAGSPEQQERAVAVINDARKQLYAILSED
jgi:DNA-binding PadR family transcriptional regulator